MTRFAVGDQVVIRYGKHQGQKGRIIRAQEPDVYQVKVADGFILFFSGKGLEKDEADQALLASSPLGDSASTTPILSRKG
jgi:ribosomal protein L24